MILGASGLGSRGAVVGVGLNIYAVNNFSGPAAAAHKSLRALQNEFRRTMSENLRVARDTYGAMALAGGLVVRGMTSMYRSYADFQYVMKSTQIMSRASAEEYNDMYKEAVRLGESTMFRSTDIANSMREMGKAGLNAELITSTIRSAVAGAGATMESLDIATAAMIATMNQFQVPASGAMRVMDGMTAAALGSRTTIEGLREALKMSAADIHTLGIPLEHALAMFMQMGNFGIDNTMAGTAVGNMFRYLSTGVGAFQTGRQAKALGLLGLSPEDFKDSRGNLKDIVSIFSMIEQASNKLSSTEKQDAFVGLFGIRGRRGANPMVMELGKLREHIETVSNASGLAVENLGKMMDTPKGTIDQLISAWDTFRITIGEALSPLFNLLTQGLLGLTKIMSFMAGSKGGILKVIGKVVISTAAAFIIMKTAIWAVRAAVAGLSMMFVSNRISFKNMKESMAIGWDLVKVRAFGYNQELKKTITLQELLNKRSRQHAALAMSGIGYNKHGNPYMKAGHTLRTRGGTIYKPGKAIPKSTLNQGGYMITSTPSAARNATRAEKLKNFSPRSRGLAKGAGRRAAGGLMGRFALGGLLGKGLALLSGPWGIALMGISMLLPEVIRAIKGNTNSLDENRKKRDIEIRKGYDDRFFNIGDIMERQTQRALLDHYIRTGEGSRETREVFKDANFQVNIDGKKVFEDKITQPQLRAIKSLGE